MRDMTENSIGARTGTRYAGLDGMKTLAIFFVILYHGMAFESYILTDGSAISYIKYFLQGLLCICVPVFFFVNGALMLQKEFDVKKHIRRLLKTVFLIIFWGSFTILILMPVRSEFFTPAEFIKSLLSLRGNWIHHLWFLCALFCVYVFLPLLKACFDSNRRAFVCFFVLVTIFTFGKTLLSQMSDIFQILLGRDLIPDGFNWFGKLEPFAPYGYAIGYFMLGGLLFDKRERLCAKACRFVPILGAIIAAFCLFAYGVLVSRRDGVQFDVVCSAYDSIFASAITVSLFLLVLPMRSDGRLARFLNFCGSNTLGIYLIHWIILTSLEDILWRIPYYSSMPGKLVFCVLLFFLSLSISALIKRIPFIKEIVTL